MSKYAKLDALIIAACAADQPGAPLYDKASNAEANRIATEEKRDSMRVLDGRMQALKRAGKIKYRTGSKARWVQVGS